MGERVTVKEAAEIFGVSVARIYQIIKKHGIVKTPEIRERLIKETEETITVDLDDLKRARGEI